MSFLQFGITLVALVLAFLVGRFTAAGDEHHGEPHAPLVVADAPEVVQQVQQVFTDGAKDGVWTEDDDVKFRIALVTLGRDGQLKQLASFAQAVNSGKLKFPIEKAPSPPPACCNLCANPAAAAAGKRPQTAK